jgi:hypothetical protein
MLIDSDTLRRNAAAAAAAPTDDDISICQDNSPYNRSTNYGSRNK